MIIAPTRIVSVADEKSSKDVARTSLFRNVIEPGPFFVQAAEGHSLHFGESPYDPLEKFFFHASLSTILSRFHNYIFRVNSPHQMLPSSSVITDCIAFNARVLFLLAIAYQ